MIALDTVSAFILLSLWLLWAGALFGGFALGAPNPEATHRIPRPLRMASSFALFVAGWMWWLFAADSARILAGFLAVGMTLGFIGDLFMARLILADDRAVLGGMGAFGAGHIAYISGLLLYADALMIGRLGVQIAAWIGWLLVAGVLWYGLVWRTAQERTPVHIAALPYALLLASTAGVATGLVPASVDFMWVAVGAALFLFSDLVLALQLFNGLHFRGVGDVVWLTYGPGQMLIVFGVWVF
jgi:hypothetical protein